MTRGGGGLFGRSNLGTFNPKGTMTWAKDHRGWGGTKAGDSYTGAWIMDDMHGQVSAALGLPARGQGVGLSLCPPRSPPHPPGDPCGPIATIYAHPPTIDTWPSCALFRQGTMTRADGTVESGRWYYCKLVVEPTVSTMPPPLKLTPACPPLTLTPACPLLSLCDL